MVARELFGAMGPIQTFPTSCNSLPSHKLIYNTSIYLPQTIAIGVLFTNLAVINQLHPIEYHLFEVLHPIESHLFYHKSHWIPLKPGNPPIFPCFNGGTPPLFAAPLAATEEAHAARRSGFRVLRYRLEETVSIVPWPVAGGVGDGRLSHV